MRYDLIGGSFPVVVCHLENGEKMITEKGSMVWMTPNMQMQTKGGGVGKMFSKALSGESMFQNIYTANGDGMITFGSSFPGKVVLIEIAPGREFIVQKSAFLASEAGVESTVAIDIQKVPGVKNMLFGGEGFFNTVLTEPGKIWLQTMPIVNVAGAIQPYIITGK